jgi:hypothetical protein
MDVHLDQRIIANAAEAVDLSGLDDEDVARAGLELHPVHSPETAALSHELNFIVRVAMGAGTMPWEGSQKEDGDVYVPVLRADELVGAALEREVILSDAIHSDLPLAATESLPILFAHLSPMLSLELCLSRFALAPILIDRLTLAILGEGRGLLIRT